MEIFLLLCLLGLAGFVGWLWQEVQQLKAQAFLARLGEQEQSTRRVIQAQRMDAEARMRSASERRRS